MLLNILDSNGLPQKIITHGQEAIVDASGFLIATNAAQIVVNASSTRSGFFLQNLGANNMWLNDLATATEGLGSILLIPGASISAPANYPVNTDALSLIGVIGDAYTLRTW